MGRISPAGRLTPAMQVAGRMKLARLLEMPEEDFGGMVAALESSPAFARLLAAGAVARTPFPKAYFAARRFAGLRMQAPADGLGDLLSGDASIVRLIRKAGAKAFEQCFVAGEDLTDAERARRSGLTMNEAVTLRAWLERLYIRTEFEPKASAPVERFSAVAGIEIHGGEPVLRFFNREVWSSRYAVDETRLRDLVAGAHPMERPRLEACLRKLELLNRRKTTLYRVLEEVIRLQAAFLRTGDPSARVPLTQRSLATAIGVDPSALNRLVSNKSVELPWGTEAPLKVFLPSAKSLALGRLESLARDNPSWSDERLAGELARRHQVRLSRRSVAQYRRDLKLGSSRSR